MITSTLYLCALLVSLMGLGYLALTDPKRRRIAHVPKQSPVVRIASLGWSVVALPGAVLLLLGEVSAFVCWLGVITVAGWLLVVAAFRH